MSAITVILSVVMMIVVTTVETKPTFPFTATSLAHQERPSQNMRGQSHQPQSLHMQIADRLLKRVLDLTYETLQEIGASDEDLDNVRRKRNYIQSCYFHAISCY